MGLFDNLTLVDLMDWVRAILFLDINIFSYTPLLRYFIPFFSPYYACPQNSISLSGAFNCIK